jgi:hypothetical protein
MDLILFNQVLAPQNSKGNPNGKISKSLLQFHFETFVGSAVAPRKAAASQ